MTDGITYFITMNQPWLSPNFLQFFAVVTYVERAPLDNYWGFIAGTVKACCKSDINPRFIYNGRKRVQGIQFHLVVTPNGLIANLFGPVEGRKHDNGMLGNSGPCTQLQ